MKQTPEQRVAAVRILLSSFFDYLPAPVTSSGIVARASLSGPAPGKRVPCTYCRRTGKIRLSGRKGPPTRFCPLCGGLGWRPRRRLNPSHPAYEEPWDEYTGEPVQEEAVQHPHAMSRRQLDAALERLEYAEEARNGGSEERYGWERERQVYERSGSCQELRRSLHKLSFRWPIGYLQIRRTYLRGLVAEPSPTTVHLIDAAEEWLAREMRGQIRVPVWLAERVAESRQVSVYELREQGLTPGQIARRLRIPKLKVQRLLRSVTVSEYDRPGRRGEPVLDRVI